MLTLPLKFAALVLLAGPMNVTLAPGTLPDPLTHAWFESLVQPTSRAPCCSISDCHFTAYRERDGRFEVTIDGWPHAVPENAIVRDNHSPNGEAVVCYSYIGFGPALAAGEERTAPQDEIEILCFLPSQPRS